LLIISFYHCQVHYALCDTLSCASLWDWYNQWHSLFCCVAQFLLQLRSRASIMVWTHDSLSFRSTHIHNSCRVLSLYWNIYFCLALFYSIQNLSGILRNCFKERSKSHCHSMVKLRTKQWWHVHSSSSRHLRWVFQWRILKHNCHTSQLSCAWFSGTCLIEHITCSVKRFDFIIVVCDE